MTPVVFDFVAGADGLFVDATGHLRPSDVAGPSPPPWALRFTLRRSPKVADHHRIDGRCHDLAGGFTAWIDLQRGIDQTRRALRDRVEQLAYADGKPASEKEQDKALSAAYLAFDGPEKAALTELLHMVRRLRLLARWPVLFVSCMTIAGEPVPGWADLAESTIPEDALLVLWQAHDAALAEAEADSGKASASAS